MNQNMPAAHSAGDAPLDPRVLCYGLERFLLAMHGINRGYYDWDFLTGEVYLSPRWKEQLGYGDAELPNRLETWVELLHPEDLELAAETLQSLIAGDLSQYQIDYRLRHKDGSYRLIRSRGASLRDAAGKPIRLAGWQIDRTVHKRQAERLQQQVHIANLYADVSLALSRQPLVWTFLQHCVDALVAHIPLDWVGIWLREPARHGFVPLARASRTPNGHGGEHDLPLGAQTVRSIADARQRLLTLDAQHNPLLHAEERAWAQREGMSVFVGHPLLTDGRVVGVLALFAREPLADVYLDELWTLALIIALTSERLPA
jgi:PAS domain S-box-containing protein